MNDATRPYRDLIAYQLGETRRWHAWLAERPQALALRIGQGRIASVRDVAAHVAIVDLRYAERLNGMPVTAFEAYDDATIAELTAVAERGAALADAWLADAGPSALDAELTFQTLTAGTVVATARCVVAHLITHGVRHWAQVATFLRQQGHAQDWRHDYLFHHRR